MEEGVVLEDGADIYFYYRRMYWNTKKRLYDLSTFSKDVKPGERF